MTYGTTATNTTPNFGPTTTASSYNPWTNFSVPQTTIADTTRISFCLRDGTPLSLSFKDYMLFIHLHSIAPSECINKEQFDEKMGALVI